MKIYIHKVGKSKLGSYALFTTKAGLPFYLKGIASFDSTQINLQEKKEVDANLLISFYKNKVYFNIVKAND